MAARAQVGLQRVEVEARLDAQAVQQFEAQQMLAMKGNADSQYRIGEMYEQGLGTPSDSSMAFLWFNKASIQGNARAKEKLAALLNALSSYLHKRELAPDEMMQQLQRLKLAGPPGKLLEKLTRLIDQFDHDGALSAIAQLASKLGLELRT